MIFFERFEQASTRIINQLWQSDHLNTAARNEALEIISPPLALKIWLERLLLALSAIFITASILLFFAFNWAHIPPMVKMGGILSLMAVLAMVNWALLRHGKKFAADLLLTVNAFMVGIFMAVFGQIYQTGADSYTLFLMWAILILPWAILGRISALWVLWLVVVNLAIWLWWDLKLYPSHFDDDYIAIGLTLFHLGLYAAMLMAVKFGEEWLDKKWTKLVLAIGFFVPISIYMLIAIVGYKTKYLDLGFWVSLGLFVLIYSFEKFVQKSLPEYSVGFFCATLILIFALTRTIVAIVDVDMFGFLINGGLIIGLFYYAYKYYRHVIEKFEQEEIL